MELRATFQIPTLIKALTDVVLPAVDPHNKLAQEQAQLVIGSLQLIAQRLPLQYRYDRHELDSFLELGRQLERETAGSPGLASAASSLASSVASGSEVFARVGAEPGDIETANLALRESVGLVVQAAATLQDEPRRKAIESAVMAHAKDMLLRERAWLAMQGWEGKDSGLPAVESLIGART
ncbi:MAG: hypothetical protein ACT4PZ_17995 [Panacagrimonas sp.]